MIKPPFATPLKLLRERKRLTRNELTQRFVADGAGIDPGQYNRYEWGKEIPNLKNVGKLVKFFEGELSEMELLFPDRFVEKSKKRKAARKLAA